MHEYKRHIKMIQRIAVVLLFVAMVMNVSACAKAKSGKKTDAQKGTKTEIKKEPDFILDDNGYFTVIYEEDFTEDYYSKDELEAMIDSELKEFNDNYAKDSSKGAEKAEFSVDNGKAKLALRFSDYNDYMSYETNYVSSTRNARLFVGTYDEFVSSGYHVPKRLTAPDGTTEVSSDSITSDVCVVFSNQKFNMQIPGEIVAVGSDVKVEEGSKVVYTADKRENYIMYRKVAASQQESQPD